MKWIFFLALVVSLVACKSPESAAVPGHLADSMALAAPAMAPAVPVSPRSSFEDGAWFALADSTGALLVWGGPDTLPPGPYFLATLDGDPAPLKYLGRQKENPEWKGRHIARDISLVRGHRFRVSEQVVVPDQTYLVVTRDFLAGHAPIPVSADACAEMDSIDASLIPHPDGRRVRKAWRLGFFEGRSASAVQFEGRPPLAALVVVDGDSTIWERYVGTPSDDSNSVWRVDDEGVFSGCSLAIVAAFRSNGRLVIARTWAGPEGESDALLQESADSFAVVGDAYRYWSPE